MYNYPRRKLAVAVTAALLPGPLLAGTVSTITVDHLGDTSAPEHCTLRDALAAARDAQVVAGCNAGSNGQDVIEFSVSGDIYLDENWLLVDSDVVISGPGSEQLTIHGPGSGATVLVYDLAANSHVDDVVISGVGITAGSAQSGGGILALSGKLTLDDVHVFGNQVNSSNPEFARGGGLHVILADGGELVIENSVISGNTATSTASPPRSFGGGLNIVAEGVTRTEIRNTLFENNETNWRSGGLHWNVSNSSIELDEVTMTDNRAAQAYAAAGLYSQTAESQPAQEIVITHSVFDNNELTAASGFGFAVHAFASFGTEILIEDSAFSNTQGAGHNGGGLGIQGLGTPAAPSSAIIRRSTFSGNRAEVAGGLYLLGSALGDETDFSVLVEDSLILDNHTGYWGGGLSVSMAQGDHFVIENSTISGNLVEGATSATYGGVISAFSFDGGLFEMRHVTVTDNESEFNSSGLFVSAATQNRVEVHHSVISGNRCSPEAKDCFGEVVVDTVSGPNTIEPGGEISVNFSLLGSDEGFANTGSDVWFDPDPGLGALADNGGSTLTHLPMPGSPVIDAGDPEFKPPPFFDQRGTGFPRIVGKRIDLGAVEAPDNDQLFQDRFESSP